MEKISIGDKIIGTVVVVRPYAVFMSFDSDRHGLLHISEISDSYIKDIEKYASKGDQLLVKVIDIDSTNGFLRVSLKQIPEQERFSTHKNGGHTDVKATEDEFKTLKEKLPVWILETIEKMG